MNTPYAGDGQSSDAGDDAVGARSAEPSTIKSSVTLRVGAMMAAPSTVLAQLPTQWLSARHSSLAIWRGADDRAGTVSWQVPQEGLQPVSHLDVPRSSAEVMSVIEQLAGALDALHAAGVGAFDLSPQHVYADASLSQCVLLPSPWLAKAEDRASAGAHSSFVAPEVGSKGADPVKADVYALGALAWYLLIGEPRSDAATLPSDVRPALAEWDALIDGCCRTHPARRFPSVASVLAALPATPGSSDEGLRAPRAVTGAEPVAAPVRTVAASAPPARSGRVRPLMFGAAAVLALAFTVWVLMHIGGGLAGADYVQGFAGTVVRYADRDYEGASWQKLYAAANLGELPVLNSRTAKLQRITGVDEDNLWVADAKGVVFRLTGGHWEVAANQPDASNPLIRLIDNETLLMGGYRVRNRLYLIGPDGVRTVTYDNLQTLRPTDTVTPIAPGLSYIHSYRETYKLIEGKLARTSPGTQKDSVVVDEYGAPVNIVRSAMTPTNFGFSAALSPGTVYAVWMDKNRGVRLVEYRDGAWVMLDEIAIPRPEIAALTAAWIGKDAEGRVFVVFGGAGGAMLYRQGEGVTRYPINSAPGGTLIKLMAVWGVGPEKFWVMDQSGSVWARSSAHWRPVIRGLFDDNIKLNDAWVSATGVVFAVADDALYRLN